MYYLPYKLKSKERMNSPMILLARGVAFLTFLLFFIAPITANSSTLKIGVSAIGETFDYRYTLDANSYWVIKLLSTGLLKNVDEDIVPDALAQELLTSVSSNLLIPKELEIKRFEVAANEVEIRDFFVGQF